MNPLLTKSGRARPSFKVILHLSSLSALRLSLLAAVLGEGGVLLLPFVELEEGADVKDAVAGEDVEARLEGRRVWGVRFGMAVGRGFEVVDRETVFNLLEEGDRMFTVFLCSGVLGSGFNHSFVGVAGVNQSAYS